LVKYPYNAFSDAVRVIIIKVMVLKRTNDLRKHCYNQNMKKTNKIKTYTLDKLTDKYIGKRGNKRRAKFEYELKHELQLYVSRKRIQS